MSYDSLTNEQIRLALSFCDVEDQETWVMCGMAVKSELGESGKQMWLDWSMLGSTYNQKQALNRWRSFKLNGGTRIGSLIHEAKKWGFKFDANQNKVSKHVVEQRKIQRLEIEKQAEKEIQDQKKLQALKAIEAQAIWRKTKPCDSHPYLMRKDVLAHGLRLNDKGDLVVPLYAYGKIVSVQTINADGEKKYMYGAQKSGVYNVIGSVTDSILICEGWATGATLHEATQLCVFVSLDSGNLPNVAAVVRKMHPLSKIIICADNDQYKKVNTGLKAADKAACKADADVVYPIFKDVSTKPTDFNDLYILEGYSPIIDAVLPLTKRQYKPRQRNAPVFDAFKLSFIEGSSEKLETSSDPLTVACAAMTVGMKLSEGVPAFNTVEQIRRFLDHPLIHYKTHTSIMCRILWSIQNRKRRAMTAIKPQSWKKHNHMVVASLNNVDLSYPVNVVFAPMGSGKTRSVIKPFSESTGKFVAVAHRRSLIADLSDTLNIKNYNDIQTQNDAMLSDKIAICLPSTMSSVFKPFIEKVNNVAIDEISQNIRFTNSKECKVIGSNQEDIFYGLRKLINESDKVVVCDASIDQTTIDFLEIARPDEQLNIIEQVPNNNERECHIYTERSEFLTKVMIELQDGGKVWLAVESAEKAEVLSEIFKYYKVMTITSKNSKNKKIKEFLENIDNESRNYDLVIASPAISSGVSVEHKDNPHFTMIAGMASGHSICFSDFAQMLGRVRYVKNTHVYLQKNNIRYEQVTTSSILTGLRQAAMLEGVSMRDNEYTSFKAHIDIVENEYRADFANGFVWFMQYYCFEIKQGIVSSVDYSLSEKMKQISSDLKEKYRNRIKIAKKINKDEAKKLEDKQSLSDDEESELMAFKMRASFNFNLNHDLTDIDIEMFENLPKVDRFARLLGLVSDRDDSNENIALRKFEKAQVRACADIFENIDLSAISNEDCEVIFKRISNNDTRFLYSTLKITPSVYGKWQEDSKGKLRQYPEPKIKTKSISTLLDKFGLSWKQRNSRDGKYYSVNDDQYNLMKSYAISRYS